LIAAVAVFCCICFLCVVATVWVVGRLLLHLFSVCSRDCMGR
jgi:hypothetical protein